MRISDWSSDVCSSDLRRPDIDRLAVAPRIGERLDAVVAPVPHARGDIDILGQAIAADDIDGGRFAGSGDAIGGRSEEHTSELQSLMRNSYDVFCLITKNHIKHPIHSE